MRQAVQLGNRSNSATGPFSLAAANTTCPRDYRQSSLHAVGPAGNRPYRRSIPSIGCQHDDLELSASLHLSSLWCPAHVAACAYDSPLTCHLSSITMIITFWLAQAVSAQAPKRPAPSGPLPPASHTAFGCKGASRHLQKLNYLLWSRVETPNWTVYTLRAAGVLDRERKCFLKRILWHGRAATASGAVRGSHDAEERAGSSFDASSPSGPNPGAGRRHVASPAAAGRARTSSATATPTARCSRSRGGLGGGRGAPATPSRSVRVRGTIGDHRTGLPQGGRGTAKRPLPRPTSSGRDPPRRVRHRAQRGDGGSLRGGTAREPTSGTAPLVGDGGSAPGARAHPTSRLSGNAGGNTAEQDEERVRALQMSGGAAPANQGLSQQPGVSTPQAQPPTPQQQPQGAPPQTPQGLRREEAPRPQGISDSPIPPTPSPQGGQGHMPGTPQMASSEHTPIPQGQDGGLGTLELPTQISSVGSWWPPASSSSTCHAVAMLLPLRVRGTKGKGTGNKGGGKEGGGKKGKAKW